ncbi:unnamed protein product [Blumeria hordei]|uniref:Uncharacterized protein n=1 Tax=Blumeria hordei TaxID=2867405 RepID=A0A383UK26_BLUHO|nr:unnamed protein product [Blumeria hordei]
MSGLKIKDDTKIQGNFLPKAATRLCPHHHTSICEIYISRSNNGAFKPATQMESLEKSQGLHVQKESIYDFSPKDQENLFTKKSNQLNFLCNTPMTKCNKQDHQKRQLISRIRPAIQRKSIKPKAKQSLISSRRSLGLSRILNTGFSTKDSHQISKHIQIDNFSGNDAKNSLLRQASPAKKLSKFHGFDIKTTLPTCREVDLKASTANYYEEQIKSRAHKDQLHTKNNKGTPRISASQIKTKPRQKLSRVLPGETLELIDSSTTKVLKLTKALKDDGSLYKDSPSSKILPESEMREILENPVVKDGHTTNNYSNSNILNNGNSRSHIFDHSYLFEPNESKFNDFPPRNQLNIKKATESYNISSKTSIRNKKSISNERQDLSAKDSFPQDGAIELQPQNFKSLSNNNLPPMSDDVSRKQKYQVDTSESFKELTSLPEEHISKGLKPRSVAPKLEITSRRSSTSFPTADKIREIGSFISKTSNCDVKKANIHHRIHETVSSSKTGLITKSPEKNIYLIGNDGKMIPSHLNPLQKPTNFELLNELVVSRAPENKTDQNHRKRNKSDEDADLGSKKKCKNNTRPYKNYLPKTVSKNEKSPKVEGFQKSHEIKSKMNESDLSIFKRPMRLVQLDKQKNKPSINSEGSEVERRESKFPDDNSSDFSENSRLTRTRSTAGSNHSKTLSPNILLNYHRETFSEKTFVISKDIAANERQKSNADGNNDRFLQQKKSDTPSKKRNTNRIVSSNTPINSLKEQISNLKNISSHNDLIPIQTPKPPQNSALKDDLSIKHDVTQNICNISRLSDTNPIHLKPVVRKKYRRTRVTQNGSPIGGEEIEPHPIKNLGIDISPLEGHQQPKKNLECQACELSAPFGPKCSILKRVKAGPSSPEAASTELVLHKTSDDISYTDMNNHQVISQKIPRDPFYIQGSSCENSPSIESSPDPISKTSTDSTKNKSRLHKVSINPRSRQYIQDNKLSPCKKKNKQTILDTQHKSRVCSKEEEKLAQDRWNSALRPHYQGIHNAVRRIVDEIILRLVQEEDSMSLLVNQYKENGGKIINMLSLDHTRERDSITKCLHTKIDEILRDQSAAQLTFLEHTERIKKSTLNTIEENWEKRQDEIQIAISEGRISSA